MKTITVSGAHSSIGKTLLAQELLRSLPDWSALKVTVRRGVKCPRLKNCGVCESFSKDYDIVTDKKTINQKGTDTARLKQAGAKKVVWLKATLKGLKQGLGKALRQLRGSEGVIIEGTSVLRYIKPNLAIYLKDNTADLRATVKEAEKKADIIINVGK